MNKLDVITFWIPFFLIIRFSIWKYPPPFNDWLFTNLFLCFDVFFLLPYLSQVSNLKFKLFFCCFFVYHNFVLTQIIQFSVVVILNFFPVFQNNSLNSFFQFSNSSKNENWIVIKKSFSIAFSYSLTVFIFPNENKNH